MSPRDTDFKRSEKDGHDSAAIFALAYSLHEACTDPKLNGGANPIDAYDGRNQFIREIMRVAYEFEAWACAHIDFEKLNNIWPYLAPDKFGCACIAAVSPVGLADFNAADCLRVALRLRIPVRVDGKLPIPISLECRNPVAGSEFRAFRIQTVRDKINDESLTVFSAGDDPFDTEFSAPYFGLYGVRHDDLLEHIADRSTYTEAAMLAQALAPSIVFPAVPCSEN